MLPQRQNVGGTYYERDLRRQVLCMCEIVPKLSAAQYRNGTG